jgi:hypothetical protein
MLKKLFQFVRFFFCPIPAIDSSSMPILVDNTPQTIPEPKEVPTATMDFNTGKITLPDNLSPEEKAELTAAMEEFRDSLQKFAPEELFKSFEDFLKHSSEGSFPLWEGLTAVNKEEAALCKVKDELEFCDETTEHWNDMDFAEALHSYEAQGYEFSGVQEIYRKLTEKLELSQIEQKQLRDWYKLATQENVYEV